LAKPKTNNQKPKTNNPKPTTTYNRTMPVKLDHLLSTDGSIARRLDGFEPRRQQMDMARAVEQTLNERGRLLVEAGTGVGKSFAYLIPAIQRIVNHNERVIVSTHTINLQEQLIDKDIPLLNAVIPEEFSAVLVKGRGNYVSLRRLKLASERQDRLFASEDQRRSLHMLEDWAYSTRDGSRSSLPVLPRPEVWDYAQSDSHNCMGRKCPTYDKCFYQQARRRMENGHLLVCNHALFFADLALRTQGAGFLPPYDHVILDEAHAVEDVAAEHFGLSLSETRVTHLLRLLYQPRTGRGFLSTFQTKDGNQKRIEQAIELTRQCQDASVDMFAHLADWQQRRGPRNGRMAEPDIVSNPLTPAMKKLSQHLKILRDKADREADEFELNSYVKRAEEIARDAEILLKQQIDGCVYFLEGAGEASYSNTYSRSRKRRITIRCVTIDVGPTLRERLFDQEVSTVMTSATLATGQDDFSHIVSRLGCDGAETLALGSPFDYREQMRFVVDRSMPNPNHPKYVEKLAPRIEQLIKQTDGGAFVLFTSFKMLNSVADMLRPQLREEGYPVLVHGRDGPPGLLLKRFREDERTVLFGTASFWQGVDVRGKGLRNVIISRLPFDVPDRPVIEARHERIAEQGKVPFIEDQVPRAVIRFKQGIGRLIRSHTDEGQIAVLDPRIVTKPYGRMFLGALPEGVEIEQPGTDCSEE